jgi:periplasmic divalent cation tolerance protein
MSRPLLVLTTVGATFDATPLSRALVEQRLCACVNVVPAVTSIYRWEGAVMEDGEQLLVVKTVAERLDALRDALFAMHPYDLPEFVVVAIDSIADGYRRWLEDACSTSP